MWHWPRSGIAPWIRYLDLLILLLLLLLLHYCWCVVVCIQDVYLKSFASCSSWSAVDSQTTATSLALPSSARIKFSHSSVATALCLHATKPMQLSRYDSKSSSGQKYPTFPPSDIFCTPPSFQNIDGCLESIIRLIEENSLIIAGVAVGIAVLEVLRNTI